MLSSLHPFCRRPSSAAYHLCFAAGLLLAGASLAPARLHAADYYVSPGGDDGAAGTQEAPFRTIARAMEAVAVGDRCILRAGTYREAVVVFRPSVTVMAYAGEYVLLTGCDELAGPWTEVKNPANGARFLQTTLASPAYAVFVDGRSMPLARWPDKTAHPLSLADWAEARIEAPVSHVKVVGLPERPAGFWNGGIYMGLHTNQPVLATWFSLGARIVDSAGNDLTVADTSFGWGGRNGRGNGFGYIIGAYNALDHADEWHWGNGRLSLAIPQPGPGTRVEAQTRRVILTAAEPNITLTNLNFRAGTVLVPGSGATITGCTFRDISPFQHIVDPSGASNWGAPGFGAGGVFVSGDDGVIRDSYFGGSWWSGLTLAGSRILVENCLIEDCNWIARRGGGIQAHGDDITIRHCTIRRTGGASIEGGNSRWLGRYAKRALWEYNRCEDAGCLFVDHGFFYVNHQAGDAPPADSVWRYNLLLRNFGPDRGVWSHTRVGLYIDNSSSGYKVYRNIVAGALEGMRYNDTEEGARAGKDVYFVNNTCINVDQVFAMSVWNQKARDVTGKVTPARMDAGLVVRNNLGLDCGGFGAFRGQAPVGDNNYGFRPRATVVDDAALDFRLRADSPMIDAGAVVPGITDGFAGEFPDIGACENGGEAWTAGATLTRPNFPDDEPPPPLPADRPVAAHK